MVVLSYVLMTVLMILGLFLIGLILLQRGRGGGLAGAFGGMGGQSAFGTKAGDVFTRITIGVATAWILLCAINVVVLHNSAGNRIGASVLKADEPAGAAADPVQKGKVKDNLKPGDDDLPVPAAQTPADPAKPDEQKPEGEKAADEKPAAAKPDEAAKQPETKPAEPPKDEQKPVDPKPDEKAPEQPKQPDPKPDEQKKPDEPKPEEKPQQPNP